MTPPLTDAELEEIERNWREAMQDTFAEGDVCRLLAEVKRLREALVEIADAGSGGGVKRRQIARRALAGEEGK